MITAHSIAEKLRRIEALYPEIRSTPGYQAYRADLVAQAAGYELGYSTEENLREALEAYEQFVQIQVTR